MFTRALIVMLAALFSSSGYAVDFETLLMPGKVSNAHAKYESTCNNCHDRSDRGRQSELCLACHKDVATDVRGKTGFHGKLSNIERTQCRACHSEHLGRDADILRMNVTAFRHDNTDYPLKGQHALVECSACHQSGKKYREAPSECVACHRKNDPHENKLGDDCGSCHEATRWNLHKFDHNKTKFVLRDKHTEVPCLACHFGNRYKNTPTQCISCHAPDDAHARGRGIECNKCHTPTGWQTTKFDHFKETKFALEGVHADTDCLLCHKTGRMQDKIAKTCNGCHAAEDYHASRLGASCDTCHDARAWRPNKFDHNRDTKFALAGKHVKVDCHACHTGVVGKPKLAETCNGCHRASDVHAGKLGTKCEQCHSPEGWRVDIAFDHDLSTFPLVGLHVNVPCAQCHVSRSYKGVAKDCNGCHERDDVHKGGLGVQCADCHTPNGWGIWEFDHAKKTHFALTGAHKNVTCAGCHKLPAHDVKLSTECASCHGTDDVHVGQFGRQCQRCHSTASFKGARLR
jgi:hypothetical protein